MYLIDIIGLVKNLMDEDKKSANEMKAAGIDTLKTYYQGRYDAYNIILPLIKTEAKRLNQI